MIAVAATLADNDQAQFIPFIWKGFEVMTRGAANDLLDRVLESDAWSDEDQRSLVEACRRANGDPSTVRTDEEELAERERFKATWEAKALAASGPGLKSSRPTN